MKRRTLLAAVAAALLVLPAAAVRAESPGLEAAKLVDKAKWVVESFKEKTDSHYDLFRKELKKAAGVVVFPNVIKAGFILGAEGGHGVLVARKGDGSWGYPAFYTMGGGSIGFQAGGQASEIVLILRNSGAVRSVIEDQGKLGADLEVTAINVGAGMEASTTTNLGADILAFSSSAGLFGGGAVEGSVLARRGDWNEAFYGTGATPEKIVLQHAYANAKADGLRAALDLK